MYLKALQYLQQLPDVASGTQNVIALHVSFLPLEAIMAKIIPE
jgi:hypothetical protein